MVCYPGCEFEVVHIHGMAFNTLLLGRIGKGQAEPTRKAGRNREKVSKRKEGYSRELLIPKPSLTPGGGIKYWFHTLVLMLAPILK